MKKTALSIALVGSLLALAAAPSRAGFLDRLKDAANAAKQAADEAKSLTKPDAPGTAAPAAGTAPAAGATAATPQTLGAYQNYDFTPGDTILFADDFGATRDGEFPAQWSLTKGQAVVNHVAGRAALLFTDGNYARVAPRVKAQAYLGPSYTIEYDTYVQPNGSAIIVFLQKGDVDAPVTVEGGGASFYNSPGAVSLRGSLPAAIRDDNFRGHWHHVAIAVRDGQLKVYVDQYRVLVVPEMKFQAANLAVGGIGDPDQPLVLANFRLAAGGGMNLVGQRFTGAKIVTHGINFDIDQATLRPESMGTLNQIVGVLNANPGLKFEVGGHTDSTGASAHNLLLSQQRADAVKTQLVAMGVDAARLTTKGYGDSKPIASNDTPEGRANNRRVEFVRTSP